MSVTGLGALEKMETKHERVKSHYGQAMEHNSAMNLHLPSHDSADPRSLEGLSQTPLALLVF